MLTKNHKTPLLMAAALRAFIVLMSWHCVESQLSHKP